MQAIQKPRGTNDFFNTSALLLNHTENIIKAVVSKYNFSEIRTPLFEYTELFTRGIGTETDIVSKEMFSFEDRGGRSLTLRPEGTASVVRAYLENKLNSENAVNKLYYLGTMYRAERPQKGRYREFRQFGLETIGSSSPLADVEIILLNLHVLKSLGIENSKLYINSVGCKKCKPNYEAALREHFKSEFDNLCGVCKVRYEKNILRMLDCKEETCKKIMSNIPKFEEHLCEECATHFDTVKKELKNNNIEYEVNPMLVRGLDYYTKTVFEVQSSLLGSQSAILGGGRYDYLIGEFNNGHDIGAVGSAMGIERILLIIESLNKKNEERLDVFIVAFEDTAYKVMPLAQSIRENNFSVEFEYDIKSIKSQFKMSSKKNARYTIILGSEELTKGKCKIKNMDTTEEKEINITDIKDNIK